MLDTIIEILDNEVDLFLRIKELKALGYEDQDMYVITKEEESVAMLKGFSNVMIKDEDHSLYERFKSFLKGEDSIIDAFKRMGLEKEDKKYYYNEIEKGRLLLLVDKHYESNYVLGKDGVLVPKEAIEDIEAEHTERIKTSKLQTTEELPDSIKRDIGIEVGDEKEEEDDFLKRGIPRDDIIR